MTPPARFLPPPGTCESLADIVPRFGGSLVIHTAASRVEYQLPEHATAELREFLRPLASINSPPTYVARLPGGRVFGSGIVLSPDGQSLARDVSVDFGKPFADHWLLTYPRIKPAQSLRGTAAVVATTLGSGYSHWLLEELPRLLALPRGGRETLIAHRATPVQRAALELSGFPGAVLSPGRFSHYACEELIIPSLIGEAGHPTPQSIALLREFTAQLIREKSSGLGERLYVTREKSQRRRITNEPALWSPLQEAGFTKVILEDLGWAEQINAFRHARVIVAPHGAGLANLAFCQPGTKVVELFQRSYVHWTYWQLASLLGLDYRPVVGAGPEPLTHTRASNRLDFAANVSEVLVKISEQ